MSGPKRNPDKLNTIGVVVVGICGAVMVYVTIVALQAFYINDTSEIQTMADYGGQDKTAKGHKTAEMTNLTESAANPVAPGMPPTFRVRIEAAMKLVADDAKQDPAHLVPALPRSEKPTIEPVFGRPKAAPPATPAPGQGSAAPATGSAAGSAAAPTSTATPTPSAGSPATGSNAGSATPSAGSGSATQPKKPKQPKKAGGGEPKTP